MNTIKIFVSYSHQNSDWVEETGKYKLIPWLKSQLEQENVVFWTDHALINHIGEEFAKNIEKNISEADITILLISQEFSTSKFILENELRWIKEEYDKGTIKIIPLLIGRLAKVGKNNISWIFDLQTIPNDTKPLIEYTNNDIIWSNIKIDILNALTDKLEAIKQSLIKGTKENDNQEKIIEDTKNEKDIKIKKRDILKSVGLSLVANINPNILSTATLLLKDDLKIFLNSDNTFKEILPAKIYDIEIKFRYVQGSKFFMGATKEQISFADDVEYPVHEVQLDDFYMAECLVTQHLWKLVMGYNPSVFGNNLSNWNFVSHPISINTCPIENITFNDIEDFIKKINEKLELKVRLPTEAEWEYAARGGVYTKGFIYSGSNDIDEVAWYRENSDRQTHPVGMKKPNELGLYDMSGNVWEWTSDRYSMYDSNFVINPVNSLIGTKFVRRGGSWWHEENNCRVSKRYVSDINKKTSGLGFRLAIEIPKEKK
jgi:formylglycine-generating enzyme required for sulfatase activity